MSPSVRVGLLGLLICLFTGLTMLGAVRYRAAVRAEAAASLDPVPEIETERPAEPEVLVVHVAGSVANPGVYRLEPGARVSDAIALAGGALPDGFPDALNLAGLLRDGEKIYLPSKAEVAPSAGAQGASHLLRGSGTTEAKAAGTTPEGPGRCSGALLVISRASEAELDALPHVTPKMAVAIVEYREAHGPFRSPEELERVRGIGSATVGKLCEKVKP